MRLDRNALTGTLPGAWSNWEYALVTLHLEHNQRFQGGVPAKWLKLTWEGDVVV